MKRLFLVLVMLITLPVQSVNAARKWADTITLDISKVPDDAKYVDVLVDIKDSSHYTEFDSSYMQEYSFDTKELAEYDKDGFVSFSCHYKDKQIKTDLHIKEGKVEFAGKKITNQFFWDKNRIKIAVVDKSGHILHVSDIIKLNDDDLFLAGEIKYNAEENAVEADIFDNRTVIINWAGVIILAAALIVFIIVKLIKKRHKNNIPNG